jgi:hypothetical protein
MKTRCWVWTAAQLNGYGVIGIGADVVMFAHRVSWELHHECDVPHGKLVLHECDLRSCIRPNHVYAGSHKDNSRDAVSRGRARGGGAKGERQHLAKLTADKVRFIRASDLTSVALATMFGVTHQTVLYVKSRATWKHVE